MRFMTKQHPIVCLLCRGYLETISLLFLKMKGILLLGQGARLQACPLSRA